MEIPLKRLFESPTVAEMAMVIADSQAKKIDAAKLAELLTELELLSEKEAQKLLTEPNESGNTEKENQGKI